MMLDTRQILPLALAIVPAMTCAAAPLSTDTLVEPLQEIVVTGTNEAVDGRYLPYTVSVVDRAEIEAASSSRILDILTSRVPGFFTTARNVLGYGISTGGSGHIKLRGVGGDRASGVLMMVDGQPQFAGIYSHHIGDFYTSTNVERVEVLRGSGSVLYGSNAMAGVVNIVTRRVEKEGFHGTLSANYGSYDTWQTEATASWCSGRLWGTAGVSYERTDGTVTNFDFEQISAYGKVGYDFSDTWKGYADYTFVNFNAKDPVYPTLTDPESTDIYRQDVIRGEASVVVSNSYEHTNGVARIYYNYGNHYIDDPRHFHSTDDRMGVLIYQNFDTWRNATATAGFDFARYSGRIPISGGNAHHEGSLSTMGTKVINEYSPYITLNQRAIRGILTLSAGLRVAMSDRFDTHIVPQGGISVNLPHHFNVKASAAMGYRNPSFREMFLYRYANPDLKPERMMNYELSLTKHFGNSVEASLTGYYIRGYDMINQDADLVLNVNTGRFINKGIEFTAAWRICPKVSARATYSYLHSSLDNITGAPRHQYYVAVEYRPVPLLTLDANVTGAGHLYVASGMDYQSYATVNVKARWQAFPNAAITLRLDNVTDTDYTINRGYTMPGFCVFGGITLSI